MVLSLVSVDKSRLAGEPSPKEHFHLFLQFFICSVKRAITSLYFNIDFLQIPLFQHDSQIQWYQKILSLKMANFHKFLHGKGSEKPA